MESSDLDLRASVRRGFLWVGSGQFVGQLISWIATIVVIRQLAPSDYGLVAMSASFVWLLSMMSELGIGASLVQAREITYEDMQKVYGLVLVGSAGLMVVGHLTAPLVAGFYAQPKVAELIQVTNLSLLLTALYVVPQSIAIRNLNFALKIKVEVAGQVSAAFVTVALALGGAGVWALVIGPLSDHVIRVVGFNLPSRDRVTPRFDMRSIRRFIAYGLTITGDRLAYYLHTVSDTVIIGRMLGNTLLGTYSVSFTLASLPSEKLLPIVTQISFASYSRIQDDVGRIGRNVLRSIQLVSVITFPLFFIMSAIAPEAIVLILGRKWESIVVPFRVLCLIMPLKALSPILAPAVFATGKPGVHLVNMIGTFVVMATAFLFGVRYGVVGVCLAWVFVFPLVFLVTTWRCAKAIDLRLVDILREMWFPLLASASVLSILMALKSSLPLSTPVGTLGVLAPVAVACYAGLILLFRRNEYLRLKHVLFG